MTVIQFSHDYQTWLSYTDDYLRKSCFSSNDHNMIVMAFVIVTICDRHAVIYLHDIKAAWIISLYTLKHNMLKRQGKLPTMDSISWLRCKETYNIIRIYYYWEILLLKLYIYHFVSYFHIYFELALLLETLLWIRNFIEFQSPEAVLYLGFILSLAALRKAFK